MVQSTAAGEEKPSSLPSTGRWRQRPAWSCVHGGWARELSTSPTTLHPRTKPAVGQESTASPTPGEGQDAWWPPASPAAPDTHCSHPRRCTLTAPQICGHVLQQLYLLHSFSAGEVYHQDPVTRREVLEPVKKEAQGGSLVGGGGQDHGRLGRCNGPSRKAGMDVPAHPHPPGPSLPLSGRRPQPGNSEGAGAPPASPVVSQSGQPGLHR